MGMKVNWLWALCLAVLIRSSGIEQSTLGRPPNLQCACPNDRLSFNCMIVLEDRIGTTIWSGTAFTGCDGDRIQLQHSNENAVGQYNNGALSASLGIVGNYATSELNITVDSTLNSKTVQCVLDSISDNVIIGEATIMVMTGPYQQAPGGVTLIDVRRDQLVFSWSQIDPNCPTVEYLITSDCGSCSLTAPTSTVANCYDLQLSTTARKCTFSVSSEICGFTGPSSNLITVTLKVPDAPHVNLVPVYSSEFQALTNLVIIIRSEMDPFSIYEGMSMNYTIQSSLGTIKTIPATDCVDSVCKYMDEVRPPLVCPSLSDDSTVSVSAANRLGPGPASQPITVGCTNRFVTVGVDTTASILTCWFQNNQNTIQKTCGVVYGVCGQEQIFTVEGNSTAEYPDKVTLQLSLPIGTNCYTYTITAYDGTSTAMVEGRVNLSGQESAKFSQKPSMTAEVVVFIVYFLTTVVAIVILFCVIFIYIVIGKSQAHAREKDYHYYTSTLHVAPPEFHEAPPDSLESKGKIELSDINPTYAELEHVDSGVHEPENLHREESNLCTQDTAKKVLKKNVDHLLDDYDNVTAVHTGYRNKNGIIKEGEVCLVVWVEEKLPKSRLEPDQVLPEEIEGVPVDVVEGEMVYIMDNGHGLEGASGTANDSEACAPSKYNQLKRGDFLISHIPTRGTLGCYAKQNSDQAIGIIGAGHFMPQEGIKIQVESKVSPEDYVDVAKVVKTSFDDERAVCDCGFAVLTEKVTEREIQKHVTVSGIADCREGDKVYFHGGKSKLVNCSILATDFSCTVKLRYTSTKRRYTDKILLSETSESGDSGALLIKKADNTAVGLVFAHKENKKLKRFKKQHRELKAQLTAEMSQGGSETTELEERIKETAEQIKRYAWGGMACPIGEVQEYLEVTLITNNS